MRHSRSPSRTRSGRAARMMAERSPCCALRCRLRVHPTPAEQPQLAREAPNVGRSALDRSERVDPWEIRPRPLRTCHTTEIRARPLRNAPIRGESAPGAPERDKRREIREKVGWKPLGHWLSAENPVLKPLGHWPSAENPVLKPFGHWPSAENPVLKSLGHWPSAENPVLKPFGHWPSDSALRPEISLRLASGQTRRRRAQDGCGSSHR